VHTDISFSSIHCFIESFSACLSSTMLPHDLRSISKRGGSKHHSSSYSKDAQGSTFYGTRCRIVSHLLVEWHLLQQVLALRSGKRCSRQHQVSSIDTLLTFIKDTFPWCVSCGLSSLRDHLVNLVWPTNVCVHWKYATEYLKTQRSALSSTVPLEG